MKAAICSHCGRAIHYDEQRKEWLHYEQDPRTGNLLTCARIGFARPRRGTIEQAKKGESR